MKKHIQHQLLTLLFLAASLSTFSQVGVGTTTPEGALDVVSTDSGMIFPRVANTAAVTSPVNGMMVFDISSTCIKTYENNIWSDCLSATGSIRLATSRVKISPTESKDFLCHNLGVDLSLNPHVPFIGLNGAYIQWGKRGPNTTGDATVDWQTADNNGALGFAAVPNADNANEGAITGWSTTAAADDAWNSGTEAAPVKTANDPCPAGFRVPTRSEWLGVIDNNTQSRTGTFSDSSTNYGAALHYGPDASTKKLTLPAAGYRLTSDGSLSFRGFNGYYWSSTEDGSNAYFLFFTSNVESADSFSNRTAAKSVRCIEE